jgi:hypothetical protein
VEEAICGSLTRGEHDLAKEKGTERAGAIERPLSAVQAKEPHPPCVRCGASMAGKRKRTRYCGLECTRGRHVFNPATMCGGHSKRPPHALCTKGRGEGTRHASFGRCKWHGGNTPNGETEAEKERLAAQRIEIEKELARLAQSGNPLSRLDVSIGDSDGVVSLKKALAYAEWRLEGLTMMVRRREQLHGFNHLLDQAVDVVFTMHGEELDRVASIASQLAKYTSGAKVTVESRFAVFAQYSDDELDAAIAEANRIVASARKGETA